LFWRAFAPEDFHEVRRDHHRLRQAGNPLAYRLADLGWSVTLIEKKDLGGTCINVGLHALPRRWSIARKSLITRETPRAGASNASNVSV